MSDATCLAMLGGWEILLILLVLLVMAGMAVGLVLLAVWLARRGWQPAPGSPGAFSEGAIGTRPSGPPSPSQGGGSAAPPEVTCPRCGATLPPHSPQGLCPRCVLGVGLATQTEVSGEFGPHGTKIVPPPDAEIARRFPQLEILGCLGHGGMGVVYKARQPKLDRLVALKILAPEKGADPKFAGRFLREARALARLSHPNIVTVYDFGEMDGMFFLLMEFVDGMTLRQLLREGRMQPEEALAIVPPICEALQFAHEQGVVHRDIKPENVLLDKQGRVKIADFGIAKLVGTEESRPSLTEERSVIGTPHYMAPEQVEKPQRVDHRADIYSLGVVFYEMLTGELPLGKFQPPSKKVQLDVRLDEVVLHTLEKEPERRYQRASQLKTDVETIAATPAPAGSEHEAAPTPGQEHPGDLAPVAGPRESRFSRTALWGAFCLGLAVLGFAVAVLVAGRTYFLTQQLPGSPPLAFPPPWRLVVWMALCAQAVSAICLLTGTTLGWVAITQIRHSRGRLHGLGLALFDALLLPLLALNGLLIGAWRVAADPLAGALIPLLGRGPFTALMLGTIAASCGLATWLIIRAVWRAANQPPAHVPATPTHGPATGSPAPRAGNPWKVAVAVVSVALLLVVFLLGRGVWRIVRVANSTKEAVRSEMRYKPLNSSAAPAPAMQPGRLPSAHAIPGVFQLTLTNGVSVEVVAVTRNPLENPSWWKPDGTPLPVPPGERVVFHPAGMIRANDVGLHEHALFVRYDFPPNGQSARHQTRYTPAPEHLGTLEIQRDDLVTQVAGELTQWGRKVSGAGGGPNARARVVGYADVVRFPADTTNATALCATAVGPWEAVAVFRGRRTEVLVESVQVLFTHLRQEADGKCLDVTHDVDQERYALRMTALLKDGVRAEVGLHSGLLRTRETQGYVQLEPGQRVEDIEEFALERTPWVRCEIRNIPLTPRDPPADSPVPANPSSGKDATATDPP